MKGSEIQNFEFALLGDLLVEAHGRPVEIGSAKQRALLARLLVDAGTFVSADAIIDALWGERPPATAAKNLQVLVGRLREAIEPGRPKGSTGGVIASGPAGYRIDPSVTIDAHRFGALLERARDAIAAERFDAAVRDLRTALELWRGPALVEFAEEEWARPLARRLDEERLEAIELRVAADIELGRHESAIAELDELVERNPLRERLRELQMLALYRAGRQADALEAYRTFYEQLQQELALEPGPAIRELERRILEQDPALQTRARMRVRLPAVPVPPTGTLGRERELEQLRERVLDDDVRLVTVTGWGGTGKTRVASELGRAVQEAFEDVGYVELAPVSDATMVPSALEAAFGITQSDGDVIDAVARFLGDRRLLLILDNFEHVLDAADVVTRLLESCPQLTVLVTSRTRLGVYGEHEFALEPLEVPSGEELDRPEQLVERPALRLFEARGREVNPDFRIDAANVGAVARICARVDGLPLGIELAAARVKLLSPIDILARLDHRLTLLTSGAENLPARQRSLRAAIEWSYDLLDEAEQRAFQTLGVFVGSWRPGSVLAVAGTSGLEEIELLDALEALVSKSLVQRVRDDDGRVRLTLLETISEFARELVRGSADEHALRRRHAEHFLAIARSGDTQRGTRADRQARAEVASHLQNIRVAHSWALEHDPLLAGQLMSAVTSYYVHDGPQDEGWHLAELTLKHAPDVPEDVRASVLLAAGTLAFHTARGDEAIQRLGEAIEATDDPDVEIAARIALGEVHNQREEFDLAHGHADRALALVRDTRDPWRIARATLCKAAIEADSGNLDVAVDLAKRAKGLFAEVDDEYWTSMAAMLIAVNSALFGGAPADFAALADSVEFFRAHGHLSKLAHGLCFQLRTLIEMRSFELAVEKGAEAVAASRDAGDSILLLFCLAMDGIAAMQVGDMRRARASTVESLEIAVRTGGYRFAPYGFAVIAHIARLVQDPTIVASTAGAIDPDYFLEEYDLDCWMAELVREDLDWAVSRMGSDKAEALVEAARARAMDARVQDAVTNAAALPVRTLGGPAPDHDASSASRPSAYRLTASEQ